MTWLDELLDELRNMQDKGELGTICPLPFEGVVSLLKKAYEKGQLAEYEEPSMTDEERDASVIRHYSELYPCWLCGKPAAHDLVEWFTCVVDGVCIACETEGVGK